MADQMIKIEKKKSELNAKNRFDYEKLMHNSMHLISCNYEEEEEEVLFSYQCSNLTCSRELKREDVLNQIQFLVNFIRIYELYMEYKIKFSPENIYYDENYMPCIMERDLYGENEQAEEKEFLFLYKTYVGAVLGDGYTVTQLQDSGLEVLEQNTSLKAFMEAKTKEDLVELLRQERTRYSENQKNNMVRIGKKENLIKNIVLIVSPIILISVVSLLVYYMAFLSPYQKSVIAANEAFVQKNYVECIDELRTIDMQKMNVNTKYILAFSYAKSENLQKEEIEMLTSRLSVNSNERELEYWICLGRLDMTMAENLAQTLSDDKLLIYAYMKELNQLENNTTMDGEEKQSRISELEDAITKLGDKYEPEDNTDLTEPLLEETTEIQE